MKINAMSTFLQYVGLSLLALVISGPSSIWATYPFPILHHAMSQPRPSIQRDTGYVKRYANEPSVFAVPSRGLRSPWSYVTPFGAQALHSPQTRLQSPIYGVPSNSLWTNALFQYGDSPRLTANQELPGEFLQEPVSAPDYEEGGDEYDDNEGDNVGDLPSYPELAETLPATLDWGFVPALEDRSAPRYVPEDRRESYRDMLLPYLLYSAMDQESGLRQKAPQTADMFSVEQRGVHPQERLPMAVDKKRAFISTERTTSTVASEANETTTPTSTSTSSSSESSPVTQASESVKIEPKVANDFTQESSPQVKAVAFDRGQKEFPMLRPPSANRVATLKALSWPKELERDDTEEQKRQLRQLPLEESTRHEKIGARHWPTALDDVDDWLTAQLNDLKTRDH